jgi:hypothetical protein
VQEGRREGAVPERQAGRLCTDTVCFRKGVSGASPSSPLKISNRMKKSLMDLVVIFFNLNSLKNLLWKWSVFVRIIYKNNSISLSLLNLSDKFNKLREIELLSDLSDKSTTGAHEHILTAVQRLFKQADGSRLSTLVFVLLAADSAAMPPSL